jgi:hypothetical protein
VRRWPIGSAARPARQVGRARRPRCRNLSPLL